MPVFGYKSHVGIDRRHGLIRTWTVTHAAAHDGGQLRGLLDAGNTASAVWADTAYRSAANLAALAKRAMTARLQRPKPRGKPMPPQRPARQRHARQGPGRGRACLRLPEAAPAPGRPHGRASPAPRTKLGLANLAYNLLRFVWLEGRAAPA